MKEQNLSIFLYNDVRRRVEFFHDDEAAAARWADIPYNNVIYFFAKLDTEII